VYDLPVAPNGLGPARHLVQFSTGVQREEWQRLVSDSLNDAVAQSHAPVPVPYLEMLAARARAQFAANAAAAAAAGSGQGGGGGGAVKDEPQADVMMQGPHVEF
jgi:hypothetical protein